MERIVILVVALVIFYSMADYSTTVGQILMLFTGGFWASCWLPNGIWYVSVASKLMNSLSSVEGILGIKVVIFDTTADYSMTTGRTLMLFVEGCWP